MQPIYLPGGKGMTEKQYKAIGYAGAGSLVIGILSVVFGIVAGVILIVSGAKMLGVREKMLI